MSKVTDFPDVEKLQQHTYQKFNQDGISELIFGIIIYLLGFTYQNVAFIGFSASIIVFGPKIALGLREIYIYPRLGYVKVKIFPITTRRMVLLAIIFGGTFLIEILAMFFLEHTLSDWYIWQKWLPILFSSAILVYSFELIRLSGQMKYISIYILAFAWGLFISLAPLGMSDPIDHFALYALLMGLFWLIFGWIRLRKFIKKYPRLTRVEEFHGEENKDEDEAPTE